MLETERLILRPLTLEDEDDVFIYQSDPDVVRYIPWPVRSREAVRDHLSRAASNDRFSESGDFILLAVAHKTLGRVIGQMNLGISSKDDRQGEFGYVIGSQYAGQGFATEASRALLDYAFRTAGLHRVTARIDTRNAPSAAVAQKLGMRREGEFVEDEFFKGEWSSSWIYALLESEWPGRAEPRSGSTGL